MKFVLREGHGPQAHSDLDEFARRTEGLSFADIAAVLREAAPAQSIEQLD